MRKRNKYKSEDQLKLNFQTTGVSRNEIGETAQSKHLSKKPSEIRIQKIACSNKKPSDLLFDNLITVEELAVVFGLAPQTIRNWVALGKLPYVKVGKRNLFLKGSLQEWLNRKEKSQWQ